MARPQSPTDDEYDNVMRAMERFDMERAVGYVTDDSEWRRSAAQAAYDAVRMFPVRCASPSMDVEAMFPVILCGWNVLLEARHTMDNLASVTGRRDGDGSGNSLVARALGDFKHEDVPTLLRNGARLMKVQEILAANCARFADVILACGYGVRPDLGARPDAVFDLRQAASAMVAQAIRIARDGTLSLAYAMTRGAATVTDLMDKGIANEIRAVSERGVWNRADFLKGLAELEGRLDAYYKRVDAERFDALPATGGYDFYGEDRVFVDADDLRTGGSGGGGGGGRRSNGSGSGSGAAPMPLQPLSPLQLSERSPPNRPINNGYPFHPQPSLLSRGPSRSPPRQLLPEPPPFSLFEPPVLLFDPPVPTLIDPPTEKAPPGAHGKRPANPAPAQPAKERKTEETKTPIKQPPAPKKPAVPRPATTAAPERDAQQSQKRPPSKKRTSRKGPGVLNPPTRVESSAIAQALLADPEHPRKWLTRPGVPIPHESVVRRLALASAMTMVADAGRLFEEAGLVHVRLRVFEQFRDWMIDMATNDAGTNEQWRLLGLVRAGGAIREGPRSEDDEGRLVGALAVYMQLRNPTPALGTVAGASAIARAMELVAAPEPIFPRRIHHEVKRMDTVLQPAPRAVAAPVPVASPVALSVPAVASAALAVTGTVMAVAAVAMGQSATLDNMLLAATDLAVDATLLDMMAKDAEAPAPAAAAAAALREGKSQAARMFVGALLLRLDMIWRKFMRNVPAEDGPFITLAKEVLHPIGNDRRYADRIHASVWKENVTYARAMMVPRFVEYNDGIVKVNYQHSERAYDVDSEPTPIADVNVPRLSITNAVRLQGCTANAKLHSAMFDLQKPLVCMTFVSALETYAACASAKERNTEEDARIRGALFFDHWLPPVFVGWMRLHGRAIRRLAAYSAAFAGAPELGAYLYAITSMAASAHTTRSVRWMLLMALGNNRNALARGIVRIGRFNSAVGTAILAISKGTGGSRLHLATNLYAALTELADCLDPTDGSQCPIPFAFSDDVAVQRGLVREAAGIVARLLFDRAVFYDQHAPVFLKFTDDKGKADDRPIIALLQMAVRSSVPVPDLAPLASRSQGMLGQGAWPTEHLAEWCNLLGHPRFSVPVLPPKAVYSQYFIAVPEF